jgi:cellulose biosynthesis protein BcsQ
MHVCDEVMSKIPSKVFKTPIRRLAKVAEAAWTGAPTVILNRPSNNGAGAGSREYWSLTREYHLRVLEMRREFGVNEHPRLLLERQGRA